MGAKGSRDWDRLRMLSFFVWAGGWRYHVTRKKKKYTGRNVIIVVGLVGKYLWFLLPDFLQLDSFLAAKNAIITLAV